MKFGRVFPPFVPAKAGTQFFNSWAPAFAGANGETDRFNLIEIRL